MLEGTIAPDSLRAIDGLGDIDPKTATTEEILNAMKAIKPKCTGYDAPYDCENHTTVPVATAGELIDIQTGDELSLSGMKFQIVDFTGSATGGYSGRALIKVPYLNHNKIGVAFTGIKVREGGCVVEGRAAVSDVDVSVLSAEMRAKVDVAYAKYVKTLDFIKQNAGTVAKVFNSMAGLLADTKSTADNLLAKLSSSNKPTKAEIDQLAKQSTAMADQLQKDLDAKIKAFGADLNATLKAEMQTTINTTKAKALALGNISFGRPEEPLPQATVEALTAAITPIAAIDPVKIEKNRKTMGPLVVEYNGKDYKKSGVTLSMKPGALEGIIQPNGQIPLQCGFYLKHYDDTEPISWKLETTTGTELPLEPPLLVSLSATGPTLGFKWPDGYAKLKLTAQQGTRKLSLNLEKPEWYVKDLVVSETRRTQKWDITNGKIVAGKMNTRTAKAGETLYLVHDNNLFTTDRKPVYKYATNLDDFLLKKYITHHNYNSGTSYTFENGSGPYSHKITMAYDIVPASFGVNINTLGYDKTVKVQLVPFDKREDEAAIPVSILGSYKKIAKAVKDYKNYKSKLEEVIGKTETGTSKEKGLDIVGNGQTYNEEDSESKNYFAVREWELKLAGSVEGTFKYGATSLLPNALSKYIDLYAYAGLSLDVELIGGEKWAKTNGVENEKRLEIARKVQIVGGAKIGATANVHAGSVANVDLDAHGKGEIEGGYNFATAKGYIILKPIVFNFSASVTSFDIEILKYNYIKNLTNEYPIYNP